MKVSDIYSRILLQAPTDSEVLLNAKIIDTMRDFCTKTWCWQYAIDPVNIKAGVTQYDIDDNPTNTEIIAVAYVWIDDKVMTAGVDYIVDTTDHTTLILKNPPQSDSRQGLDVTLVLKPTYDITDIDDQFWTDYKDVFVDGTIAELLLMPKQTFTDPARAVVFNSRYKVGISTARINLTRGKAINGVPKMRLFNSVTMRSTNGY